MKITTQLLRSRAQKPLHACEILDLSNLEIDCVDRLHTCHKLKSLTLRGNNIGYVSGVDGCSQLWRLDLSTNKIQNLDGLRRFVAMGTLILSNNNLSWTELAKIRHMHILDLSLHGNPSLERDPYYRIHVIDTLPNIWMLDGRIVTSAERVQVQQFFEDSALTEKPVRHKLSKDKFTPTIMKRIEVTGIFGERTDHLMRRFPVNGALNIETDKRRLKYLAYSLQEDILLETRHNKRMSELVSGHKQYLEDLLEDRNTDRIRCNMMLLILVASLEFAIPIQLMQDSLRCTKLDKVGSTDVMTLFLLPRELRCLIVSLLLSAIKVDKDVGEDGGLYDKLYLCLYYSVSELTRLAQGVVQVDRDNTYKPYPFFRDSKSLIASEVVQLFCVVPAFFECLCKDAGVMNLVAIATADPTIVERIQRMMKRLEKDGCDEKIILESVSQLILTTLHQSNQKVFHKTKDQSDQAKYILNTKMAIPRRPKSSIMTSDYHSTGRTSPQKKTPRLKSGKHERRPFMPIAKLGEKVLLGPQNLGRIISIPEPDLVLIQMDVVPAATGAMIMNTKNPDEHFTYVDISQLYWDNVGSFWRPKGTVGDRITLQHGLAHSEEDTGQTAKKSRAESANPATRRVNVHAQLVDLVFQGTREKETLSVPEPVSARYKKQWNLRLSWKHDSMGEESQAGGSTVQDESHDMDEQMNMEEVEEDELTEAQPEHTHSDAVDTVTDVTMDIASPDDDDTQVPLQAASRRSSLESTDEPELEPYIADASRPSTAGPRSRADSYLIGSDGQSLSAPPIQIPSMPEDEPPRSTRGVKVGRGAAKHDHVEFEDSEIVNKEDGLGPSRPATGRTSRNTSRGASRVQRTVQMSTWPRPISAVDTYRMIVSQENRYYTQYQTQRTNAWRNGDDENNVEVFSQPPPQRPPSPMPKDASGQDKQHMVKVQRGEVWLGGGRDLHWEKQLSRPRTAHTPGWLEGLPQRPQSAAAVRAMRRSKTPNIATPSSIAYESLFAMDVEAGDGIYEDYGTHRSPVPGGENQMPAGSKLQSHPFAKYVYVMRERHKLRDTVMCTACKDIQVKQEVALREILGTENTELVNKLVAMEPCSHVTNGLSTNQLPLLK